eukprot:COSAG01_NODE_69755_length_260_cov_0.968944_1_plen_24_part_10
MTKPCPLLKGRCDCNLLQGQCLVG